MALYRLNSQGPAIGDNDQAAAGPGEALFLDFMEIRRESLLKELRFIEGQLVEAGRIKRLTVAPGRQR